MNFNFKRLKKTLLILTSFQIFGCGGSSGDSTDSSLDIQKFENGKRYLLSEKISLSAPTEALEKANFNWQQIDGDGELSIENSDTNTISLSSDKEGSFNLQLKADELTYTATIVWDTKAPIIDLQKSLTTQTEVELNPTVEDASNLVYSWSIVEGGNKVSLSSTDTKKTKISASENGKYKIKIIATDEMQRSSEAEMEFTWDESFKISVVFDGVPSDVTLQIDQTGEKITESSDGTYQFNGGFKNEEDYTVSISEAPHLLSCALQNASGTMTSAGAVVNLDCEIKKFVRPNSSSDKISDNSAGNSFFETSASRNGTQIRVFSQYDGSRWRLSFQENTGSGWSAAVFISPPGANGRRAHAEINNAGDAIIAFNINNNVAVSHKKDGVWTHPSGINDVLTSSVCNFLCPVKTADIDKDGNIIIMYNRSSNGSNLYHSTYTKATNSWASFHSSLVNLGSNLQNWKADFNDNGDGIVAFQKNDGINSQLYRFERINGAFVNIPTNLSDHFTLSGGNAYLGASIAISNTGDAIIPYYQRDGSNVSRIYVSEKINGSWKDITDLVNDAFNKQPDPQSTLLSMNSQGNAVMAYLSDNPNELRARTRIDGVWSDESPDLLPFSEYAEEEQIAMDENNNAVISFFMEGSIVDYHLFVAHYTFGKWYFPESIADDLHYTTDSNYAMTTEGGLLIDENGTASVYFGVDHNSNGDYEIFEAIRK